MRMPTPRAARLARICRRMVLVGTALVVVSGTGVSVRSAQAAGLSGPAGIVALDHSGRMVTLEPWDTVRSEGCQSEVVVLYCDASRIDRLTGTVTHLPNLVTISADQSALITPDRRWLDIDSGESTPLPAGMAMSASSPIMISSNGRVYAGSNSARTAGWVVEGASGVAQSLPILGAPTSVSATGRFVLIRSLNHCQDFTAQVCDQYLWDRALGARVRVGDARKVEFASNVAADGSVIVVSGDFANRTFRREQIGATPVPLAVPTPAPQLAPQFVDTLSDDGSTAIFGHVIGSPGTAYFVVDLATGALLSSFNSSIYAGFSSTASWQLSGDGSTLATQFLPSNGGLYGGVQKLSFLTLRSPTARVHALEEFSVGVGGVAGVPADATAVMANVTVTDPVADGFVTVWPCGEPRPLASNGNFTAGQTVATAALVRVGPSGRVCASSNVDVNLVVDIEGWVDPASPYRSMTPTRLLDSRQGPGASTGAMTGSAGLALPVAGVATIGADSAAVVLNVTAVDPSADGFVTVWPCGQPRPNSSSLNFPAGRTVANLAISAVGPSGTVCFASNVDTQIVVDAQGWFAGDSGYRPINPTRLTDTRAGESDTVGNLAQGTPIVVPTGSVTTDATAVMLNIAVTNPAAAGWLVAWPCNEDRPVASNINFVAGQTVANAVLAKIDAVGDVCIAASSAVDVVVDITGTFGPKSPYHPLTPTRALDTRS